jgi:hypothetical protein
VEHGAGIEQLGIEAEFLALAGEGSEVEDAAGVVEEQLGLGVAYELLDLAGELGVGDGDTGDRLGGDGGGHGWFLL